MDYLDKYLSADDLMEIVKESIPFKIPDKYWQLLYSLIPISEEDKEYMKAVETLIAFENEAKQKQSLFEFKEQLKQ
jgi:hypothetical protein